MWLHGAPVPRHHLPHPRIPAVTQNKAIPFTTGVRLDGGRSLPPGIRQGAQPCSASVTLRYGRALSAQTLQPLLSFCHPCCPSCPGSELTVICLTSSSASSCEESPAAKQAVSTASAGTAHSAPTPPSPQEGQRGACDLRTVVLTGPI